MAWNHSLKLFKKEFVYILLITFVKQYVLFNFIILSYSLIKFLINNHTENK